MKLYRGDLTALRKTRAHWRRMRKDAVGARDGDEAPGYPHSCPLCQKHNQGPEWCARCPVFRKYRSRCSDIRALFPVHDAWYDYIHNPRPENEARWQAAADRVIAAVDEMIEEAE